MITNSVLPSWEEKHSQNLVLRTDYNTELLKVIQTKESQHRKQEGNATTSTIKRKKVVAGYSLLNLFWKFSKCAAFENYFLGMAWCTNPSFWGWVQVRLLALTHAVWTRRLTKRTWPLYPPRFLESGCRQDGICELISGGDRPRDFQLLLTNIFSHWGTPTSLSTSCKWRATKL